MEKITLYSKPNCVQCTATKTYLDRNEIPYEPVDVTQDESAYNHIVGLGYQQVPVIEAGGRHWSGFDPGQLATL